MLKTKTNSMYYLFKNDPFGNKVPMMVATEPFADQLLKEMSGEITRVVVVPRNVKSLISAIYGR